MKVFVSDLDRDIYYGDPDLYEQDTYQFEQQGWRDAKLGLEPRSDNCFYRRGYEAFKSKLSSKPF